jgi:hypothetical protein
MARYDAATMVAKWQQKTAGATQDYVKGVQGYQGNPMQDALAHKQTMVNGFNRAMTDGTYDAAMQNTPKQRWVDGAVNKGAQRLAQGVQAGTAKFSAYAQAAASQYAALRAEIRAMPNDTDAAKNARMQRNIDLMRQFKGLGKGR